MLPGGSLPLLPALRTLYVKHFSAESPLTMILSQTSGLQALEVCLSAEGNESLLTHLVDVAQAPAPHPHRVLESRASKLVVPRLCLLRLRFSKDILL